jgi:hypothetical protein
MLPLLRGFEEMNSFERAVSYVEKAEEYYEMAFQEYTKGNWTDNEKIKFHKLLIKTLDEAAHSTDFMDRI